MKNDTIYARVSYHLKIIFLVGSQFQLKKGSKTNLINSLLSFLDEKGIVTSENEDPGECPHAKSNACVIDFMSVLRKRTSVDLSTTTTKVMKSIYSWKTINT